MMSDEAALPPFRCPRCKGPVERRAEPAAYRCSACARIYPIRLGIPDFRVWPDRHLAVEDDWARAMRVLRATGSGGFRAMLEHYWRLSPDTPAALASRFVRYALVGVARGRTRLGRVAEVRGAPLGPADVVLDLGCGTGGLVVAGAEQAGAVVGVDIAARWLIVARRQLEEAGVRNAMLVCACAEQLPFADGTFDVVVASDVLEHSQAQARLLGEIRRALRPAGLLLLVTQNRWSLLGEPHARVWGVGFLPRRWMNRYVRLVRGVPYRLIRLVSPPELDRLLRGAGLRISRRLLSRVASAELEGLAAGEWRLALLYRFLSRIPALRLPLLLLGPAIEVAARPDDCPAPGRGR
ncbi:MAG: methyltransferase domain-containing protein [Chloroflexi bacterium]|nr:methyltransferase domain-containing protein [Chloroflexota bacterium]